MRPRAPSLLSPGYKSSKLPHGVNIRRAQAEAAALVADPNRNNAQNLLDIAGAPQSCQTPMICSTARGVSKLNFNTHGFRQPCVLQSSSLTARAVEHIIGICTGLGASCHVTRKQARAWVSRGTPDAT